MTVDSAKVEAGFKEKVVGNVEQEAGKLLSSDELKQQGLFHQLEGEKKLEQAREGVETLRLSPTISPTKSGKKHKMKKTERKEELYYEGGEREGERIRTGPYSKSADVTTTRGETIKGETTVYEHVHPVTVIEAKSIEREEKPKKKKVHVVQHIEPIQVTEVHKHIEPVEVVHKREVYHPHEEVYVHEHIHPVEVTEVHEHIKPEVHSVEKKDVYPDVVVKEKHEEVLGTEASRAEIHRNVEVSEKDLGEFDIKTGGMREKHHVEGTEVHEREIKPTAIHHEKHGEHLQEREIKPTAIHHEKHGEHHPERHSDKEGSSSSSKKKKKKSKKKKHHHHSDTGTSKPAKTTEKAPKV